MDIERLFPLLVMWILYQIFFKKRAAKKQQSPQKAMVSVDEYDESLEVVPPPSAILGPVAVMAEAVRAAKKNVTGQQRKVAKGPVQPTRCRNRRFLRRAVIWSEILGPPVCLRKLE